MGLPAKYQRLLGKGLDLRVEGKRLILNFSDFEKFRDFLLIYNKEDFLNGELEVNSYGECQGGCGQVFMGELSGELLSLAAVQAKETQLNGGNLIVHMCPICQIKDAGGLQELCNRVENDKKRLLQ